MSTRRARLAAAAVAAALGLLPVAGVSTAQGATAPPAGNITNIEVAADALSFVFEATGSESGIAADSVEVRVNDTLIEPTVVPLTEAGTSGAAGGSVQRTTMLVMDTSGSMSQNNRIGGARQAALAFVDSAPPDLRIGLITFADDERLVIEPTTSRAQLRRQIQGLQASGSTALYPAVQLAARELGTTGIRNAVLMTDGKNEDNDTTLAQAVAAVKLSKIRLDVIPFQVQENRAALGALVAAGAKGSAVIQAANSEQLTQQFEQAAQRLSGQLLVSVPVTNKVPRGQVTLTASGTAGGVAIEDSAAAVIAGDESSAAPVDPRPQAAEISSGPFTNENALWIVVGVFFVGLLGVLAFALNAAVPGEKKSVKKQLSVYTLGNKKPKEQSRETTAFGDSAVVHSAVDFAGRVVAKRGLEERLQRRLEAGAVPLKPAEWIIVHAAVVLILPLMAFLLLSNLVITLVALAFAVIAPMLYLSLKESRRRDKFLDQLPETLQVMAGSLSAGYSLPQAADTVVREGEDPIATEFNRALIETRLGVPIEDALESIADRMRSQDWAWVVMAIRVQREVGGNLAELLVTVAETLRERARLRRQVKVLSAEGRLSAWILGSLPVVFALYLLAARPSYIMTLGEEVLGWIMIVAGVVLLTVGALWMKKVVDVEV